MRVTTNTSPCTAGRRRRARAWAGRGDGWGRAGGARVRAAQQHTRPGLPTPHAIGTICPPPNIELISHHQQLIKPRTFMVGSLAKPSVLRPHIATAWFPAASCRPRQQQAQRGGVRSARGRAAASKPKQGQHLGPRQPGTGTSGAPTSPQPPLQARTTHPPLPTCSRPATEIMDMRWSGPTSSPRILHRGESARK